MVKFLFQKVIKSIIIISRVTIKFTGVLLKVKREYWDSRYNWDYIWGKLGCIVTYLLQ